MANTMEEVRMEGTRPVHRNGSVPIKRARTELTTTGDSAAQLRKKKANDEYGRGKQIRVKSVRDKKLRGNLKALEKKYQDATTKALDAEILLEHQAGRIEADPDDELARTWKLTQADIQKEVAVQVAPWGKFCLKLEESGPYMSEYSRNGRHLLVAGRKGHVATMDWRDGKLGCELQLGETIRDARWLGSFNSHFAVAQKKYVYIYDQAGVEIHALKKHIEVTHMEYLPHHFLLATVGNAGYLKYQDVSTGDIKMEMPTKLGSPTSMTQNPYNAIIHMGHNNGTVTLWSPNSTTPLVKLLAHHGPVRSLAVDREGRYMVSTGQDLKMAVWDVRMFKEVSSYNTRQPATSVSISDRGLTAVGWGTTTTIWQGLFNKAAAHQEKVKSPYMQLGGEGKRIERVRWCPFEDILGISHDTGFNHAIIPGAGEPNFDAMEINPYANVKQRQEAEIKALLEKIPAEMISLNPEFVGNLDLVSAQQREAERDLDKKPQAPEKIKHKMRGKSSSMQNNKRKRERKKLSSNVIDVKRVELEEALKAKELRTQGRLEETKGSLGPALGRFVRK